MCRSQGDALPDLDEAVRVLRAVVDALAPSNPREVAIARLTHGNAGIDCRRG